MTYIFLSAVHMTHVWPITRGVLFHVLYKAIYFPAPGRYLLHLGFCDTYTCYLLSISFVLDTVSSEREHEDTDQI